MHTFMVQIRPGIRYSFFFKLLKKKKCIGIRMLQLTCSVFYVSSFFLKTETSYVSTRKRGGRCVFSRKNVGPNGTNSYVFSPKNVVVGPNLNLNFDAFRSKTPTQRLAENWGLCFHCIHCRYIYYADWITESLLCGLNYWECTESGGDEGGTSDHKLGPTSTTQLHTCRAYPLPLP